MEINGKNKAPGPTGLQDGGGVEAEGTGKHQFSDQLKKFKMASAPRWPGLVLALLTVVVLLATMDMGFTRDEGYYFKAGELYSQWYQELVTNPRAALTKRSVNRHWAYNPEHPPFMKTLIAVSWRLLGTFPEGEEAASPEITKLYHSRKVPENKLALMKESTAMRFPAVLFAALLVYLVYRMGALAYSIKTGVFAAFAMMAMPRLFFHSHLACFDLPIAAMWFLTVYVFWRASSRSSWWLALAAGLCWGLAIATKHNGYFIPIVLLLWWLPRALADFKLTRNGETGGLGLRLPTIPMSFIFMVFLAPVVLYVLWPKLWFNPVGHWVWYFKRHFHHEYYWAYYFGNLLANPPFPPEFPWVMTLVTVPITTLLLGFLGMGGRLASVLRGRGGGERGGRGGTVGGVVPTGPGFTKGTDRLIILNLLFQIAIFSTTTTPIFGGTKHWMPAMPYLALFAGVGFHMVCQLVKPQAGRCLGWLGALWGRGGEGAGCPAAAVAGGASVGAGAQEGAGEVVVGSAGGGDVGDSGGAPCDYAPVEEGTGAYEPGRRWGWKSVLGCSLMGALLLAPSVMGVVRVWPEGPCYYNEFLGGFRGMGNYGMQREFWGNAAGNALDWVNEHAPPDATVFFHDTNYDSFLMYQRDGALRRDIKYARATKGSHLALFHHHAEFLDREQNIWEEYGTHTPVYGFYLDGVPILSVYENQKLKPRKKEPAVPEAGSGATGGVVGGKSLIPGLTTGGGKGLLKSGVPARMGRSDRIKGSRRKLAGGKPKATHIIGGGGKGGESGEGAVAGGEQK